MTMQAAAIGFSSTAFAHDAYIPERYTCDGENESPPLTITNVPAGTRSFALIVHDPDAVHGDFVHWLLWGLKPESQEIKAGIPPQGTLEGTNDAGSVGYTGPCPPPGTGIHHYHFELTALSTDLILPPTATRSDLEKAMESHEIARAMLVGLYERS